MSQDVKLIKPRMTGFIGSDGQPQWGLVMRGGGGSDPTVPNMGGGGGLFEFALVSDGGDYWKCKSWDGSTLGTLIQNVLKPLKLRAGPSGIASEVTRGVTYSYTYASVTVGGVIANYTRGVSGSDGSSETDFVVPDSIAGNTIIAAQMPLFTVAIPRNIIGISVVGGGTGGTYVTGNVLTVAGGSGTSATFSVVAAAGLITAATLVTSGNYTTVPSLVANAATGGGGTGATFNLTLSPPLYDTNVDARAWSGPTPP